MMLLLREDWKDRAEKLGLHGGGGGGDQGAGWAFVPLLRLELRMVSVGCSPRPLQAHHRDYLIIVWPPI